MQYYVRSGGGGCFVPPAASQTSRSSSVQIRARTSCLTRSISASVCPDCTSAVTPPNALLLLLARSYECESEGERHQGGAIGDLPLVNELAEVGDRDPLDPARLGAVAG